MYTVYTATMANAHWPFGASGQWALTIVAYTSDTRWVKAFQSYTAKQRYTALYSIQLYIAIHYTPSTTPLWSSIDRNVLFSHFIVSPLLKWVLLVLHCHILHKHSDC